MNETLHPWLALEQAAKQRPGHHALIFPHQQARLTFEEWRAQSASVAAFLAARGAASQSRIALIAENRFEWPVVQTACAALGAIFVPLNTHYRKEDLAYALRQCDAEFVICSTAYRSNPYLDNINALRSELPLLRDVFPLETRYNEMSRSGLALPPATHDPDAIAALLYTSGTTGFPKGALLSHRAMAMVAQGSAKRLDVRPGDRWTSIIPLFHCAGCILNMLGCLHSGAAYVGVPSFDPETMFRVIENERCTHLSGVPTSYLAMLEHPARRNYDLSSLRAGSCGGADCNPEILARCAEEFPMPGLVQVYGQTEGGTLFVCPDHDDPLRFETAGLPLPGYELRIADPLSLAPVPVGDIGEVQARGPMVMAGYDKQPQATAETILPDGWLRSGDLGYLREDGRLVIAGGRLRDMIIRGGENIYPAEIENLLQTHPAVAAVSVFGIADAYYGEAVAAAVKLQTETMASELQEFCNARIARFKTPARFFRVDRFPLTPSGKVRKVELRQKAADGLLEPLA